MASRIGGNVKKSLDSKSNDQLSPAVHSNNNTMVSTGIMSSSAGGQGQGGAQMSEKTLQPNAVALESTPEVN